MTNKTHFIFGPGSLCGVDGLKFSDDWRKIDCGRCKLKRKRKPLPVRKFTLEPRMAGERKKCN